jgi:hypothetical protein
MLAKGSTATVGLDHGARLVGLAVRGRAFLLGRLHDGAVDPHRAGDVLQRLLAQVLEGDLQLAAVHLVVDGGGDADAAARGELLQPRGDVDPVAVDVALVEDDVAEIDADAELDAPLFRHVGIAPAHAVLDLDGAPDRVGDALELDQHAVAGGLDDPAVVLGDGRIDQLDAVGTQARKRALLVGLHQPAVAHHVGGQNQAVTKGTLRPAETAQGRAKPRPFQRRIAGNARWMLNLVASADFFWHFPPNFRGSGALKRWSRERAPCGHVIRP